MAQWNCTDAKIRTTPGLAHNEFSHLDFPQFEATHTGHVEPPPGVMQQIIDGITDHTLGKIDRPTRAVTAWPLPRGSVNYTMLPVSSAPGAPTVDAVGPVRSQKG